MSEILETLNTRQLIKLLCLGGAIIYSIIRIIIPKIKEKMEKTKNVISNNKDAGNEYIARGFSCLKDGNEADAIKCFEAGLPLGTTDERALTAYKLLMSYYINENEQHKVLHWGRMAIENNTYDNEMIGSMIYIYELLEDEEKINELKKLL